MIALAAAAVLPTLAGVVLLLLGRRADRVAPVVSIGVAALTLAAATTSAFESGRLTLPFVSATGARLAVDPLTAVLLPTVTAVALAVLVFAVAQKTKPTARFHGLMLVFVAAVIVTVTATSLPALLGAWEIMGATSWALIGFHWRDPRAVHGGFVAFTVTRTADLGLYAAAGAAVAAGVGWNFTDLHTAPAPWVHVIAAGILTAGLGKAAQLPFSFWLSRAMDGPSPVSALLHSAAMVAMGAYLLIRFAPLLHTVGWAAPTAAWIGAGTTVVLGVIALAQTDLKQLLAASTAAQLGFVVTAAGVGATAGGTAQLIGHAATKALLFLAAGGWLTATGTKKLAGLRGVGRRWRPVGVTFLLGALSLAGIPPFALWWTKDEVLAGALAASPALYAAGLVGVALSAAYSAKMIAVVWSRPEQDSGERGTHRVSAASIVPMVVLAVGAVGLGVLAIPGPSDGFRGLLGAGAQPESTPVQLAASAVIAAAVGLLVGVLVVRRRLPRMPAASAWFHLERAALGLVAIPTLRLAESAGRFDAHLDAAIDRAPRLLTIVAEQAQAADGLLDRVVHGVVRGASSLGRAARLIQTGQIADYYSAAAVVAVGALVLLIVVR